MNRQCNGDGAGLSEASTRIRVCRSVLGPADCLCLTNSRLPWYHGMNECQVLFDSKINNVGWLSWTKIMTLRQQKAKNNRPSPFPPTPPDLKSDPLRLRFQIAPASAFSIHPVQIPQSKQTAKYIIV
jgi:hypothetical protein